jgi:hypothetical protein
MSVYFENFRELVPLRVSTGQAIHAIVDRSNQRVVTFTNFSLTPRIVMENLVDSNYEIKFNIQKILLTSGGEVFRPRMKARETTPWAFGIKEETLYDADSVPLTQELLNKYILVGAQAASVDFLIRVVNAKRREYNNISIFGQDRIYAQKLREANRVKAESETGKETDPEIVPFVAAFAELTNKSLLEAAEIVISKGTEEKAHLVESENERMVMSKKIFSVTTYEELKELMQEFADTNEGLFE